MCIRPSHSRGIILSLMLGGLLSTLFLYGENGGNSRAKRFVRSLDRWSPPSLPFFNETTTQKKGKLYCTEGFWMVVFAKPGSSLGWRLADGSVAIATNVCVYFLYFPLQISKKYNRLSLSSKGHFLE